MIGQEIDGALPLMRAQAESLMREQAALSHLAGTGWVASGSVPVRRARPGSSPATLPPATAAEAFITRALHMPAGTTALPGDLVDVAGERTLLTSTPRHTHMVELRAAGVWPAAPVTLTVVRPPRLDTRGNPLPDTVTRYTVEDAALFAVSSADPADLSQVVKTTMRVWVLPGTMLLPGDELLPTGPALPYRYIVKGDPVYSPLGVVADVQRGKVVGT